jgi:glycosyltransferase involved in cell wall biosynthesis
MKITYAVTACNEHRELESLLRFLRDHIRKEDEVIIQLDDKHTIEVLEVCNLFTNFNHTNCLEAYCIRNSKFYTYPLNNDFGAFKNEIRNHATGDFIFQLDADEIPSQHLIKHLPKILEYNTNIDMYLVPRINTVDGITEEHIQRWGWNKNERGWINFPDHQCRIYRNTPEIQWVNKVHERLTGFENYTVLPSEKEFAIYHEKAIARQEKQNGLYEMM